jgi:hypothetical protein
MPRPTTPFRVNFFQSLSDDSPVEIGPDQAHTLENLYRDRGKLKRRAGSAALGTGALAPARDHDGLAWFRLGTTDVLFASHNGSVVDWLAVPAGNTLTNSALKLTSGARASFAFVDGKVYASDGIKPMIRLTATRADRAMVEGPPPLDPPTGGGFKGVDGGAAGAVPAGNYVYRVSYLSADLLPGLASALITVARGANNQVSLSLPLCSAGQECGGRRIYRIAQGATVYSVLTTILDNTTTTYQDTTLDANLTAANDGEPNLTNDAFPPCSILTEHQGRLCGAGNTTESLGKQTLFVSNYRQPPYAPVIFDENDPNQGTRIGLQGEAAGEITGLASHGDKLWVFTAGALHVLVGEEPLDFGIHLFARHGCVSHETICSLQDKLLWLAPDGVYLAAEGQGIGRISDPVKDTLAALTPAELSQTHAFCFDQRYHLMWPGGCVWVDLKYRPFVWGVNTGTAWQLRTSSASLYQGTATPRLFGSLSGQARVVELEVGTDDDGVAIAAAWESAALDLGNPGREKRLHLVGFVFKKSTGTATVEVIRGAGEVVQTLTQDLSEEHVAGSSVCRLQSECTEAARDEWLATRVQYAADGEFQLLAADGMWSLAT